MKNLLSDDDNSGKRKLSTQSSTASATATATAHIESYNYSDMGGRSKLQLQCSDGRVFDVTHEEAMMSSTLWMLLQADKRAKTMVKQHMIPIFDVPSHSVELALFYCRCLYKQQVEGIETALHAWDDTFLQLDSKTLCDLAKVASHLDIQPLVDLTCRSIAQIMSATEAAHEIRQKFGLDDASAAAAMECSCELRSGMSGFDFDMFNSLDHDLSTDEYELVEFDQPSVDDLVSFINGGSSSRGPPSSSSQAKNCHVHADNAGAAAESNGDASTAAKKKNKKKKKKKKPACANTAAPVAVTDAPDCSGEATATAAHETTQPQQKRGASSPEKDEKEDDSDSGDSLEDDTTTSSICLPRDLHEKMRLARQNPSAIFQESQFEDDEEMEEQIESFRLALESAHLEYNRSKVKAKPRVTFAPQDVFRSTLVASQRHSSQRVSAAI
uniref:SKP1 component POZ domain-containing protein n=1 Tax=Globisporangium ultimum (strain ATCC 200006 / CBS 805.95 / DAOM BR144) TaxID=431595 RepID=K3WIB9_GLOUD